MTHNESQEQKLPLVEFEQTFAIFSDQKHYIILLSKQASSDQNFVNLLPKSCKYSLFTL